MNLTKLSQLIERLAEGSSIAELARKMNVKPGTLRTYVRNDGGYPSVETLMAIANYMGIELDELIRRVSDTKRCREPSVTYRVTATNVLANFEKLPTPEQKQVTREIVSKMLV